MYLPIAVIVGIVAFVWQLQVCFSGKGRKRLLPIGILGGCILGLTAFTWIGNALGMPSAPFGAAIMTILLMIPLSGSAMAWVVYGIVRFVQNRRE